MRNLCLTLAYDGTAFFGWQYQGERRTVQDEFEKTLHKVTGVWTRAHGSSRTDRGVHALGQEVSFYTETRLSNRALARALNAELPFDMTVLDVRDVPMDFHATRDSIRKRYRYVIQDGRLRSPFGCMYSWRVPVPLDLDLMREGAKHLIGTHDFKAYQTSGSSRQCTTRTIFDITVEREELDFGLRTIIEVEADGFLYNMVRNIAGSLSFVGKGRFPPEWIGEVLNTRLRRYAGMAAPAQGLFLLWIEFPACESAP